MPTVTRYGERRVGTAPLPGVRKTAATTALAEGAGLEQARAETAQSFGRLGQIGAEVVGAMVARERQRADEVALLEAENRLSACEQQRLYDPAAGALTRKGKDALPLPEAVGAEFHALAGEIAAGLSTDRQRAAFARVRAQRGDSLQLTLRRHTFTEMQQYEATELRAYLDNATQAAVANALDPRRVGLERDRAVTAIRRHGARTGLGPEAIEAAASGAQSAIHVGVIDRLLASDQDRAAQIYFEETRGQILGDTLARVERALRVGSVRGEAQRRADAIVAAGGTLTEQRTRAKAIEDPELRDAVMERIEHEAVVQEKEDRDRNEARMLNAYTILDQTHDITQIPADDWELFTGQTRSAMRSYTERLAAGTPVETDWPTYYALMQQAAGVEGFGTPTDFVKQNLMNYRDKLGDVELKQATGLQLALRQGQRDAAEKELAGFSTKQELLDGTLTQYGIDPKAKHGTPEANAIAQLRRMLDRRLEAAQDQGQKVTNVEIQQALDGLLSQDVTVPGAWWAVWPGGKPVRDTRKRLIELTVEEIPADERTQIEQALRQRGRPVSDATVLDLYLEHQIQSSR